MLGAVALYSNTLNLFSEEEAEVHLRWQSRDWNPGLANLNDKPTQPGDFQTDPEPRPLTKPISSD